MIDTDIHRGNLDLPERNNQSNNCPSLHFESNGAGSIHNQCRCKNSITSFQVQSFILNLCRLWIKTNSQTIAKVFTFKVVIMVAFLISETVTHFYLSADANLRQEPLPFLDQNTQSNIRRQLDNGNVVSPI